MTRSSRENVLFYRRLVVNTIMRFIRPRINKKNWEVNSYALTNYKLANFALTAPLPPAPPCTFVLSYSKLINFVKSMPNCLGDEKNDRVRICPYFFLYHCEISLLYIHQNALLVTFFFLKDFIPLNYNWVIWGRFKYKHQN